MSYNHNRKYERAALGLALERAGWKLYGWSDDKSDAMTDYFCPASWEGVATLGDAVAVVGAWGRSSGQEIGKSRQVDDGPCPTCGGTGDDPSGWTLAQARENPREYHKATCDPGCVPLFPDVVSPIPFRLGGRLRCRGRGCVDGRLISYESDIIGHWPIFQENPKGVTWHVERGGVIIARGNGLKGCDRETAKAGALAARITAAADSSKGASRNDGPARVDAVTMTENPEKGGIELRFPAKPCTAVLDSLKGAGWRWSRFSACWWHRDTDNARAFAAALTGSEREGVAS